MVNEHFQQLLDAAARYRELASENYKRIRGLAEALQSGFCGYLGSGDPPCVLLVPPGGAFEPKQYGDHAFSVPPKGFQPLGPVSFGLAVRMSEGGDWLRLTLTCVKEGENFRVNVGGGGEYRFQLPLADQDPVDFFAHLHAHIENFFTAAIAEYEQGEYGGRDMGFDFFRAEDPDAG